MPPPGRSPARCCRTAGQESESRRVRSLQGRTRRGQGKFTNPQRGESLLNATGLGPVGERSLYGFEPIVGNHYHTQCRLLMEEGTLDLERPNMRGIGTTLYE